VKNKDEGLISKLMLRYYDSRISVAASRSSDLTGYRKVMPELHFVGSNRGYVISYMDLWKNSFVSSGMF
jgi:hypothetical protein